MFKDSKSVENLLCPEILNMRRDPLCNDIPNISKKNLYHKIPNLSKDPLCHETLDYQRIHHAMRLIPFAMRL